MATNVAPPEQTLFVRKASGLVKGWSGGDGFIYSFMSVNLFLALWSFSYATFIPGGSLFWAIIITGILVCLEIVVYAGFISVMPRAGGDYVWMTRVFNSPVGFVLAAIGWWFVLWQWIPIYADMGVQTTVKPILRILDLNAAADWLGTDNGVFAASLVVIVIASILVALGMKAYARFQKWAMYIGLAGCAVAGILLLATSADSYKEKFNTAADKYYGEKGTLDLTKYEADDAGVFLYDDAGALIPVEGETYTDAFQATEAIGKGTAMPTSMFSGGLSWATWTLIPFMVFWMLWVNWGATLYGEVRGAKDFRKNVYQMLGGLWGPTMIALAFLGLMAWRVGYQTWMGSMSSFWWGISPLGGDYMSPTAMIAWIVDNAAVQILLIAVLSLLLFGWYGTVFLSSTRMVFAAAFDRILPEGAARVTSGGVPVIALLLLTIPSILTSALYAYTPINDEFGVTWFKMLTYDATVVIAIMFLGTGIAFTILPWRSKALFEASSLPKWKVAGIPVVSLFGAGYVAFLGFNLYLWFKDAVYGVNNRTSLYYMGALYLLAIAIWVIAYFVRRRQGMALETVAKEIPVE